MKNDIFGYRRKTNKVAHTRWLKWIARHVPGFTPPAYARHGDWRSRKNQKKMLRRIRQAYAQDKRPNVKWLTRKSLGKLIPKLELLTPIVNWPLRGHSADGIIFDDFSPLHVGISGSTMATPDMASLFVAMGKNRPGAGLQVMMEKPLETIKFEVDLKSIEERVTQSLKDLPPQMPMTAAYERQIVYQQVPCRNAANCLCARCVHLKKMKFNALPREKRNGEEWL